MAIYTDSGSGKNLFELQAGASLKGRSMLRQSDQFGRLNPDAREAYYHGGGLVWDQALGQFTAGTITGIGHYGGDGNYNDDFTGLSLPVATLEPLLEAPVSKSMVRALQAELLSGDDRLQGSKYNDRLDGGAGNDFISGGRGNDTLLGRTGNDIIHGEAGNDRLSGGKGIDFLTGGNGQDVIFGGKGDDTIDGGTGEDLIAGGAGNDVIYGGPDPDVMIYDFAWEQLHARYDGYDYTIWVEAPDGTDHVYSALSFATTTGTYRFDIPTQSWVMVSAMTGNDWIAAW